MDWTWLWDQAKFASPFVAVFCLAACGILWRQHVRDLKSLESIARSNNRAMVANAKSTTRLAASVTHLSDQVRSRR